VTVLGAPKGVVNSRRFKKLLPWVSALVLLAGIGAFLGVRYSNTAKVANPNPMGQTIPAEVPQKNIPFPEAAWRVAREFAFTAVSRQHLAEAYAITDPQMKGGISMKDWMTGNLPVDFMPVAQILKTNWKNTNYAHPRDAFINVILIPAKSSNMHVTNAQVELAKVGKGSHARWLVSYFHMVVGPPIPTY
jgi:hypothetical protein